MQFELNRFAVIQWLQMASNWIKLWDDTIYELLWKWKVFFFFFFLNIISSGRILILMLISDRPIMSPDPCVIWAVEIRKLPWTCPGRGWTCSGSRLPWGHLTVGTCCTWCHKNSGRNLPTLTQRTYSPASCGLDLTLKHCILISVTNKCTCHTLLEFRKARVR